jgi:hypothetical protein
MHTTGCRPRQLFLAGLFGENLTTRTDLVRQLQSLLLLIAQELVTSLYVEEVMITWCVWIINDAYIHSLQDKASSWIL